MLVIKGKSFDPYFNLAAEEYMLSSSSEDVFMLWQNENSVIIGKNQNAWAEINSSYANSYNIKIARRMTGGGAVYHDLGNVNFTFITKASDKNKLNFKLFLDPICRALSEMEISACVDGRNDIVADGYKISGNAECVLKNNFGEERILHHGTLLFNTDLTVLSKVLNPSKLKIASKGIKSVSSRVANISELDSYKGPEKTEDFINLLFEKIQNVSPRELTVAEEASVLKLANEKYALYDWIYGEAPPFDIKNEMRFPFGTIEANIKCKNGKISSMSITGDFFGTADISELEEILVGVPLKKEDIKNKLITYKTTLEKCISGAMPEDIASLIAENM